MYNLYVCSDQSQGYRLRNSRVWGLSISEILVIDFGDGGN